MSTLPPPYFYSLAETHIHAIAQYSKQWGSTHARKYVTKLYEAIERQNESSFDRLFPKTGKALKIKQDIYYFHYKSKASDRGGYCIFYRRLSTGNMGVIAIIESSRNLPEHLHNAVNRQAKELQKI